MPQQKSILEVTSSNFKEEVVNSTLPVVVEFYADWCPICHSVEPLIQNLAEHYAGKAKFVRIDTDANADLVTVYGIKRRPTILIIKNGIAARERIIGANPETSYREILDKLIG